MTTSNGPAPKPCESCPYRTDVPSGVWSASEYEKLPEYDRPTGEQPQSVFQCHQTDRDNPHWRLCAGWVGCHGSELLALRLGVAVGKLGVDVFDYSTPVSLFESGAEAAEHGMRDIDNPGEAAQALVAKIASARPDAAFR